MIKVPTKVNKKRGSRLLTATLNIFLAGCVLAYVSILFVEKDLLPNYPNIYGQVLYALVVGLVVMTIYAFLNPIFKRIRLMRMSQLNAMIITLVWFAVVLLVIYEWRPQETRQIICASISALVIFFGGLSLSMSAVKRFSNSNIKMEKEIRSRVK